jgi:rhodanese-related sulfurtransferase
MLLRNKTILLWKKEDKMLKLLQYIFIISSIVSAVTNLPQDSLKSWITSGPPFDMVLIDIRGPSELSKIIGNYRCKPYNLEWPHQFKKKCTSLAKDQHIILYCRSGARALSATAYIESLGYTNVCNAGGIINWNGPTLSGTDTVSSSKLPAPTMKTNSSLLRFYTKSSYSKTSLSKTAPKLHIIINDHSSINNILLLTLKGQKINLNTLHTKKNAAAPYIIKFINKN